MKIKNVFTSGKMNKDVDERLLPKGEYRDALNIRVANSSGSDVGAIENSLSTSQLSDLDFGDNAKCIGVVSDPERKRLYWFVVSDIGSFVCEYDKSYDSASIILRDTRVDNVLNFSPATSVFGNVLTDVDNNKKFLYFTDGINPPRKINIETARGYTENGFNQDDINVIVRPPLNPPSLTFATDGDENNIEKRFLRFAYRYKYTDDQYSALSPFSKIAFFPEDFKYDFATSSNDAMINHYSSVNVQFETGDDLVKSIELVFKDEDDNTLYVIDSFKKSIKGWDSNSTATVKFDNSKIYKVLPQDEIYRTYDNVPKSAKYQDIIGNRLIYANYIENYDIADENGKDIDVDITLSSVSIPMDYGTPFETVKSNRDYEAGIVYLDDYGRASTVLTSENNSVFIPNGNATNQNILKLNINHKAPAFANKYRIFLKPSKGDYDVIVPVVYYNDPYSGYVYVLVNAQDMNKVEEGDYLIVKADSAGIRNTLIETKVVEIGYKEANFLEASDFTGGIAQVNGTYIKLKPNGYRLSDDDLYTESFDDLDTSRDARENPIGVPVRVYGRYEGPFFYGDDTSYQYTSPLVVSPAQVTNGPVTYTGDVFSRFEITIDNNGPVNTFSWSWIPIADNVNGLDGYNIEITPGVPQTLAHGISITFPADTGYYLGDKWTINCKPDTDTWQSDLDEEAKAYVVASFLSKSKESVEVGTIINITYEESQKVERYFSSQFISPSNYDNIEEWYHESGAKLSINQEIDAADIWFVRGIYLPNVVVNGDVVGRLDVTGDVDNSTMYMIIESKGSQNSELIGKRAQATLSVSATKKTSDYNIVLETIAKDENSEIFYELPYTYNIVDGYHQGAPGDISQAYSTPATITLPYGNAFAWGNAIESYKIKDGWNSKKYTGRTRPSTNILDYRENNRTTSITWSDLYQQSTNYNGLNEFNLAKQNYFDVNDEYGQIQGLKSRDTDIIVFQDNKVSKLLYNKNILTNADGSGNISQSTNIIGQQVTYLGEYGASGSSNSIATWGNAIYFTDLRRGVVCRLSTDGINEISAYGMKSWFKNNLNVDHLSIGGYDPFTDQYVVSLQQGIVEWKEDTSTCEQGVETWLEDTWECEQYYE